MANSTLEIEPTETKGPTHLLSLAGAAAAGGLLAVQTRINGELGSRLDNGLMAALIAFVTGLALITIGLLAHKGARQRLKTVRPLVQSGALPWWTLLGGAVGSTFVVSQGLVAAMLGTALFTVAAVAGQVVGGLVLDRIGVGPGGSQAVTTRRLVGTLLCLAAVALSVSAKLESDIALWVIALPLVGGAALAWQQATNGRVRASTQSVLVATLVNFIAGTVLVTAVAVTHGLVSGFPTAFPTDPWLYLGGVSAIIFVAATAALVHRTGVLLLGLAIIAGQLITSLVIDFFSEGGAVDGLTLAGTVLALIAVLIAGSRRRARGTGNEAPARRVPVDNAQTSVR
ncbi:DMT family transporter [uncultured Arthrobacter sp.]|uniref:DMT family transporter n=1 Tax=uncultured Arthrobacter sp. TaxID=114050 RepID=UPI0025CD35CF|nr:DMT family transporter [uncultured Arthrobacter sp.]